MKPQMPWWISFLLQYHELVISLLVLPLITALGNIALRKKTAEEWDKWAMSKPLLAFAIEFMRAAGFDPIGMLKAMYRYSTRKSGKIPADAALPPALKKALSDPATRALLTELVEGGRVKPATKDAEPPVAIPPAD